MIQSPFLKSGFKFLLLIKYLTFRSQFVFVLVCLVLAACGSKDTASTEVVDQSKKVIGPCPFHFHTIAPTQEMPKLGKNVLKDDQGHYWTAPAYEGNGDLKKMTYADAKKYCLSLQARLPCWNEGEPYRWDSYFQKGALNAWFWNMGKEITQMQDLPDGSQSYNRLAGWAHSEKTAAVRCILVPNENFVDNEP